MNPDADGDGVFDNVDNCPTVANANQANNDGEAFGDACDINDDGDGTGDTTDLCPATPAGAVVDPSTGCSIDQLCPCAGPRGQSVPWKNQGQHQSCVANTATTFVNAGLVTAAVKSAIVSAAAHSNCGVKP